MASITFDGVEILNAAHMPQFVKHETAPDRTLVSYPLARGDGEVLVSTRYGKKLIQLQGTLSASSQAELDEAIDDFKELFSRPEKNLDISWGAGTLRYVATCSSHQFNRDYYHISAVPWTAEFTASSGVGMDTEDTIAADAEDLTTADDGNGNYVAESSFSFEGSKAPAPVITLEIVSADASVAGLEYKNTDTGERIIITRDVDWSAAVGKQIIIDCQNKRVTDNLASSDQTEGPFSGIFPRFAIGTNNIRIQSGGIVNQRSSDDTIPSAGDSITFADDTTRFAVSFQVPYTDETFGAIILALTQGGSPPVNLKAEIYDDDGGQPGSSIVSIDQFTTAGMPIYPTFGYIQKAFTSPHTFVANTPYWIVVSAAATGLSSLNLYRWYNGASATYSRGRSLISTDSGVSWEESNSIPSFRLLMGGASGAVEILHTVSYRKAFL